MEECIDSAMAATTIRDMDREQQQRDFFMMIGMIVTRYQHVEDFICDLFVATMKGNQAQARAIYATGKGLEARLGLMNAATSTWPDDIRTRWDKLRARIDAAAAVRNSVAHSTAFSGGHTTIAIQPDGQATVVSNIDHGLRLRKSTKSGETIWTVDSMRAEVRRSKQLFSDLAQLHRDMQAATQSAL